MTPAEQIIAMVNDAAGEASAASMRQAYLNWMYGDSEQVVDRMIAPATEQWEAVTGLLEVSECKGEVILQHRIFANSQDQSVCIELTHNQTPDKSNCDIVISTGKLPQSLVQARAEAALGNITQLPPALEQFSSLSVTLTEHIQTQGSDTLIYIPTS